MTGQYLPLPQASSSSTTANGRNSYTAESNPALVPYDGQAQQALLGSILLAGGILPDVMAALSGGSDAFWGQTDSLICAALIGVYQADQPLDGVTLTHELKSGGNYERVGGFDYLQALVNCVPSAANCVELIERVANPRSVLRGSGTPGGIAVPVSVFGGSAECANSDTDTRTTGNTDTQDIA